MAKYVLLIPIANPTAMADPNIEPYAWVPVFHTSDIDLFLSEAASRYLTKRFPCRFEINDLSEGEERIFKAAEAKMAAEVDEFLKQQDNPPKPNLEVVT